MNAETERGILGRLLHAVSGECRICGCHGDSCAIGGGERCMWVDDLKTLCNNPRCLQVNEINRKREARLARQRKVNLKRKGRAA